MQCLKLCCYARASIEYGENRDGYWTSDKFMEQLEYCAKIAECKYPRSDGFRVVWVFDHSSCHRAFAENALNAYKMNVAAEQKARILFWAMIYWISLSRYSL